MMQCLRYGWINIAGPIGWLLKPLTWFLMPRVHSLPNKMRLLTKIMADPFRLAVILEDKAIVLTLNRGEPDAIDVISLGTQKKGRTSPTLREHWLWLCKKHAFIHLAIRLPAIRFDCCRARPCARTLTKVPI